jgi:hypothetical protein
MRFKGIVLATASLSIIGVASGGVGGCSDSVKPFQPTVDAGEQKDADLIGEDARPCLGDCDASVRDAPGCVGLECSVNKSCADGKHTRLTGKVFDPAGVNPLYNIIVYVPTDPGGKLDPIETGVKTCGTCDAKIRDVVTATLTDDMGRFVLDDVPTGKNIPLVMQVGKWRREITIPETKDCEETAVPAEGSRLPRTHSEGDMPQIALVTGGADSLGCLLRRAGIDDAEFSDPSGAGRIHVYRGSGGADVTGGSAPDCSGAGCPLWATPEALAAYDIVMLTCEGTENPVAQSGGAKDNMRDYLNAGGKMFGTHFHYTWFRDGPQEFRTLARWAGKTTLPFTVDTGFAKGVAFRNWLENVGAIKDPGSTSIPLSTGDIRDDVGTVSEQAQRWIYAGTDGAADESVKYFSVNTPLDGVPGPGGQPSYCGKAVFSDIHVGGSELPASMPGGCSVRPLSEQELALEFLFFDLSACVTDERNPPPNPW